MKHGTRSMYSNAGCRCAPCTEANREAGRAYRRKKGIVPRPPKPIIHGNASTYTNHGCRCDPCRIAQIQKSFEYRAAREQNKRLAKALGHTKGG